MKKIALMLAFVAIATIAGAQSLNVTSAREAEHRGYLDKAKKLIDAACEHEQTINDAKTWYYAGLIYSRIGGEQENARSKYRNLDANWLEKCKNAALRCKELDTEKEYADGNNTILGFAGNEYYKIAIKIYNEQNWDSCMKVCEESIKLFNECGKREYATESYMLAGKAAVYANNTEAANKYLSRLVRLKSKENFVYKTLFNNYKAAGDTNKALEVAQSYVKNCPEDFNANMMMAQGYMIKGNMEKGSAEIEAALKKTQDPNILAGLLAAAGATYEEAGDFTNAETKYKESISKVPNQFLANYGMGKMLYNRAVDVISNEPEDDYDLIEKMETEAKDFFRQSIPYFNSAISYIDGLDKDNQDLNRKNLYSCLQALQTVYARLEMYDDLKPVKARITELQSNAQ